MWATKKTLLEKWKNKQDAITRTRKRIDNLRQEIEECRKRVRNQRGIQRQNKVTEKELQESVRVSRATKKQLCEELEAAERMAEEKLIERDNALEAFQKARVKLSQIREHLQKMQREQQPDGMAGDVGSTSNTGIV